MKSTRMPVFQAKPLFASIGETEGIPLNVAPDALGEGPVWDHRAERLSWVDVIGRTISLYDTLTNSVRRLGLPKDEVGFAVPTSKRDMLVCGSNNGVFLLNLQSGRIIRVNHPERHLPKNRFNDGKVDPAGRLFAGTLQRRLKASDTRDPGSGRLYFIAPGHNMTQPETVDAVGKVTVSNGLGWSPEGDKMYYVDSAAGAVYSFDYNKKGHVASHRRVVYQMTPEATPDGLCVDCHGFLWVAALRGGEVRRIDPVTGEVVAVIKVPTPLVTSCCFGGPYLSTLYITTARGTTPDTAAECSDPFAGRVFTCELPVSGLPMTPFRVTDDSAL
jgi:sugar lactone lactonase YvrE